jgi:hypothetical protein
VPEYKFDAGLKAGENTFTFANKGQQFPTSLLPDDEGATSRM